MIIITEITKTNDKFCLACPSHRRDPNKEKRYFTKKVSVNGGNQHVEHLCEDCMRELLRELNILDL